MGDGDYLPGNGRTVRTEVAQVFFVGDEWFVEALRMSLVFWQIGWLGSEGNGHQQPASAEETPDNGAKYPEGLDGWYDPDQVMGHQDEAGQPDDICGEYPQRLLLWI